MLLATPSRRELYVGGLRVPSEQSDDEPHLADLLHSLTQAGWKGEFGRVDVHTGHDLQVRRDHEHAKRGIAQFLALGALEIFQCTGSATSA